MNNNSTMQSNISNKPNNMNAVPNSITNAGATYSAKIKI